LQAADQGDAYAQCKLGVCYEHGKGVRYDMGEAVALYRRAIAGGRVDANVDLGLCFEKGRGVPLDRAEAERLYQLAERGRFARPASTRAAIRIWGNAINGHGMAPAVALDWTRNAVYDLNSARWGQRCSRVSRLACGEARGDVSVLRWLRSLAQAQAVQQVPRCALLRHGVHHSHVARAQGELQGMAQGLRRVGRGLSQQWLCCLHACRRGGGGETGSFW
jgi:hypothetical protein